MLAAKLKTVHQSLFDNINYDYARKFCEFAEAEIHGLSGKSTRYRIKRLEEAIEFCCQYPHALTFSAISEAQKNIYEVKK
jgi:hypothetical protein